jgi:hypothetical protein
MAVKKENLSKGSGFFRQQHDQNEEGMKVKRKKATKERNKTLRRKKNVSQQSKD